MQAAHLTRQQMIRAVPFDVALLNSFADVYIKPRNACDFATTPTESLGKIKNNMLKTIEDELKNIEVLEVTTASSTLRIKELCTHSAQEIANQIAYSVLQVDEGFGYYKTTLIHTLYNIFIAYQRCPKEILCAMRTVIDMNFSERSDFALKRKAYSQTLNDMAYKHFEGSPLLVANQRFYSELYSLDQDLIKSTNGSVLLLYTQLVAAYYMNVMCSEEGIKFVDYSRAIRLGNLTDDFSEYALLRNCLNFIEFVEDYLGQVIRAITDYLDDTTTLRILQLMNWKNRFYDIAFSCMFIRNEDNNRIRILNLKLVQSLYLHCKWLQKHLFAEVFKLLPQGNSIEPEFQSRIGSLTGENNQVSSKTSIISKKMRKLYGQPKLYANQEQYELSQSRRTIFNSMTIDLNKPLEKQCFILTSNYDAISDLSLASDIPNEEILDRIIEYIEKHNEDPGKLNIMDAIKIPMHSYVLHRVLCACKHILYVVISELSAEDKTLKLRSDLSEMLGHVVYYGKKSKGFGPELISLLECIQKLLNGSIDASDARYVLS